MAHMSQEHKKRIHTALKAIIPATWKWSLAVRRHSTIILTIASADVDLLAGCPADYGCRSMYATNCLTHRLADKFAGKTLATMCAIVTALNLDNYDRSDIDQDVFNVGFYSHINIGRDRKRPFVCTGKPVTA